MSPTLLALAAMVAVAQSPADAVPQRTFVIQEPFGLAWGPDRVTYRVQLIQGEARPESLRLTDGQGRDVPVQLTEVDYWPDRTARSADVSFMVSLKPDEKAVWKLAAAGSGRAEGPAGGIQVREGQVVELSNNCTAIRLAGGLQVLRVAPIVRSGPRAHPGGPASRRPLDRQGLVADGRQVYRLLGRGDRPRPGLRPRQVAI